MSSKQMCLELSGPGIKVVLRLQRPKQTSSAPNSDVWLATLRWGTHPEGVSPNASLSLRCALCLSARARNCDVVRLQQHLESTLRECAAGSGDRLNYTRHDELRRRAAGHDAQCQWQ